MPDKLTKITLLFLFYLNLNVICDRLIQKGGGIGPDEVLATCMEQGANTHPYHKEMIRIMIPTTDLLIEY